MTQQNGFKMVKTYACCLKHNKCNKWAIENS